MVSHVAHNLEISRLNAIGMWKFQCGISSWNSLYSIRCKYCSSSGYFYIFIERETSLEIGNPALTMMNCNYAYLMPVLEDAVWRKVGSMYLYIKKNLDIELDQLVKPLYTKVNLSLILIHIISKSLLWSKLSFC